MKTSNLFILFTFISFLFNPSLSKAQQQQDIVEISDDNSLITEALDSLTNLYFYKKNTHHFRKETLDSADTNEIDTIILFEKKIHDRIGKINSIIPLTYNPYTQKFIELYIIRRKEQVERMLGLSKLYFPIFESTLDKYGLPLELKYLPVIESALNTHAVSRRGATGLWQFMYTTGRLYGLNVNSYLDERRDPYKATEAAVLYLKDLYELYNDWTLVIAAYNSGPGNVNKAIRRSGGKTNFWEIRKYLPRETRGYVPAFIAANYVMENYKIYGFRPVYPDIEFNMVDTVHIVKKTTFQNISKYVNMSVEEISFLNPAIKKQIIPAFSKPYPLKLPLTKIALFDEFKDSIYVAVVEEKIDLPASRKTYKKLSRRTYTHASTKNKTKLIYEVKSGDNLGYIAEWYDCKAQDIRNYNGLYGSRIRVGQKLSVYIPDDKIDKYRNINELTFSQKQAIEEKEKSAVQNPIASYNNVNMVYQKYNSKKVINYKVLSGDTLWDIAKKYPGNTIESLKKLNNISNSKRLKPGMIIKVAVSP